MSDAIIWMLLTIGAITVLLGVFVAWKAKKKKRHEPDYRTFFWMGLIWMILGGGFMFVYNFAFNGLFAIGFIFFIMGAANRGKWKNSKPLGQNQKMLWYAAAVGLIILMLGIYLFLP